MSDKRYPTRMHEVLGVEPNEEFYINGEFGIFFLTKGGYLTSDNAGRNSNWIVHAINHGITRRPRLTEEQVRRLKALYDYGMRWIFFSHPTARDPWLYATTNKPSCTKPDWDGERLRIKGSPLNELERVCADSPLDIVQTLRDAGVEVDDD